MSWHNRCEEAKGQLEEVDSLLPACGGLRMDVATPGLETMHLLPEPFPGVDGDCFLMLTEMTRPFCGMVHSLPKGAPPAEHLHPALFSECVLNVTQLLQGPAAPTFLPRWVET